MWRRYRRSNKKCKEVLGLHIYELEENNEFIPEPTNIKNLKLKNNEIPILIEIIMPLHRKAIENTSVKKTLTIPQWLNKEAIKRNVNFSQVLQDALKDYLGLKDRYEFRNQGKKSNI